MPSTLRTGDQVDRYRVERFLGAGGMGEVYQARDGTLGRSVALKVLPVAQLSEERVRRFMAEAQTASRMKHPSIVTIHDSGRASSNGSSLYFLAMELIEGEALSSPRSRRELAKTVELMAQVAEGLAAAHAQGIVHRDLKPENIIVSQDGYAKILDFGISKLTEANGQSDHRTTDPAAVLGTVSYMSPEQAAGRPVDHRSDIFSFGTVLYELLTGAAPFDGPSPVDTLHDILHKDPPPPKNIPPELNRILRKCLARDREERYQSIKDVAIDLRDLLREMRGAGEGVLPPRRPARLALGGGVLLALLAVAASLLLIRQHAGDDAAQAPSPIKMTRLTYSGNVVAGSVSPDGNYVVYATRDGENDSLWVKQVATGSLVRLADERLVYYGMIRVSPDGNYVYFVSASRRDPNVWNIFQIPLLGGEARKIISDVEESFAISPEGNRIAFVRFNAVERQPKLIVADIETGTEQILLKGGAKYFGRLSWSPDGETIAFVSLPKRPEEKRTIEQVRVSDGSTSQLFPNTFGWVGSLQWLPDRSGLVITAADRDEPPQIWFLPYPEGQPRKITNEIVAYADPGVTRDGRSIVAGRLESSSNLWLVEPGVRAPATAITNGQANLYCMSGGPVWLVDGTILFTSYSGGHANLCHLPKDSSGTASLASIGGRRGGIRQLTKARNFSDLDYSRASSHLLYLSDASGGVEAWISNANGSDPRQLTRNERTLSPSFFPDGKSFVYVAVSPTQQFAYKMSIADGRTEQLTDKPTNSTRVSPDGRWLLCRYRQPEPGKPLWRTALISLPDRKSIRFFEVPRYGGPPKLDWLPDGKRFSFVDWKDGVANIWIQSIEGGEPRQATFFDSGSIYGYDWSPDASRLVVAHGNPVSDGVMISNFR